jgi:preprotein translocase subunit SecE
MAANRQMKRMMQRQGQVGADGAPVARETKPRPPAKPAHERVGIAEFVRQVRAELRKVAWPTRSEVINYSILVFVALLILTALIFALDYVFGKAVIYLFE